LSWTPPTTDTNGNPLSEFGYRIYYGTSSRTEKDDWWTEKVELPDSSLTSYMVENLTPGYTYYFALTAFNSNGESDFSNEVFKQIKLYEPAPEPEPEPVPVVPSRPKAPTGLVAAD